MFTHYLPAEPVANEGYLPMTSGDGYQQTTSSMEEPPRTESPKPDGSRVSRRKGTPRSHQAFLKQTLIDEGLRLAHVFNSGREDGNNGAGSSSSAQGDNYRVEDDAELRQAYGMQDTPPNVNVSDMNSEDINKMVYSNSEVVNGNNSQNHVNTHNLMESQNLMEGQNHVNTSSGSRISEQNLVESNVEQSLPAILQETSGAQQLTEHV